MATRKVTITLPVAQLERVKDLVETGHAAGVSGFVRRAVHTALDDMAAWGATLAEALQESGGPLSADERAWADQMLGRSSPPDRAEA